MTSAEHINNNRIDEAFHADNLLMDFSMDSLEEWMMKHDMLKSFAQ
jgi:hypothetical protein